MEECDEFLEKLAESKKVDVAEIKEKMTSCGEPGTSKTTRAGKSGVVVRLTDPKKYTGSRKERFDESGNERGEELNEDEADTEGYVQGYKAKGYNAKRTDKSDVVVRLTDPKKYTGSHKERFDESGKGRGKEGREDEADTEGYVQGYKAKGTYDKK